MQPVTLCSCAIDALLVVETRDPWPTTKGEAAVQGTLVGKLVSELRTEDVKCREARRADVVVTIHAAIL